MQGQPPKQFSGNSKIVIKIDAEGTLSVDFEKIYDFKKGDVWRSDISPGQHYISLRNGSDVWETQLETTVGSQSLLITELQPIIDKRSSAERQRTADQLARERAEAARVAKERAFDEHVDRGDIYYDEGDLYRAVVEYSAALKQKSSTDVKDKLSDILDEGGGVIKKSIMTDPRDGQNYLTVTFINGQTWMAQNLAYNVDGSWCYEGVDCTTYGRLYNWEMASEACPKGWHLPEKADLDNLMKIYDYDQNTAYDNLLIGGKSGFNGMFGGYSYPEGATIGEYRNIGKYGSLWGEELQSRDEYAWSFTLDSRKDRNEAAVRYGDKESSADNCRCVQDEQGLSITKANEMDRDWEAQRISRAAWADMEERIDTENRERLATARAKVDIIEGTFTDDRDGTTYKTVTFTTGQTWMAENLDYYISGSSCYEGSCSRYGRFYTWEDAKRACPDGWHLPSNAEFEALIEIYEDGVEAYENLVNYGKSGFNAKLGCYGNLLLDGEVSYCSHGYTGYYWTSTFEEGEKAWNAYFNKESRNANTSPYYTYHLMNCRCLKD